jgi:hypothetical protein
MLTFVAISEKSPSQKIEPSVTAPVSELIDDGRVAVYLTGQERNDIRGEMLAFLQAVQTFSYALADEDRDTLAETVRAVSTGAGEPIGRAIHEQVPVPFRETSQGARRGFGALADMADNVRFDQLQFQFSNIISRCAACHGSYGVIEANP